MVFKLNLSKGSNPQVGFQSPGNGAQFTGAGPSTRAAPGIDYAPVRPTKGAETWSNPTAPQSGQRGFPSPLGRKQRRPKGTMDVPVASSGMPFPVWTPYFSRGSAAYVQNFGKVLTNPIGAGIVVKHRPQASYGESGQYYDDQIFWTSQVIPTSVGLTGLSQAKGLQQMIGNLAVQAVVRTTG